MYECVNINIDGFHSRVIKKSKKLVLLVSILLPFSGHAQNQNVKNPVSLATGSKHG